MKIALFNISFIYLYIYKNLKKEKKFANKNYIIYKKNNIIRKVRKK